MTDRELITYLLGELEKIEATKPDSTGTLDNSINSLIDTCFIHREIALTAVIKANSILNKQTN